MARVIITASLLKIIAKKFNNVEANLIIDNLESLEQNPHKGSALGHVDEIVIKEIRYQKYSFYFVTDGQVLKFGTEDELIALLIKFVRMSDKKDQQKVIDEIKYILRALGGEGFQ